MADKYQNKYRIPSARLKNWDYRNNGAYFITICTKNRTHFFGEINNGKMQLSEIGELAHKFWAEIPQHFPFVKLDAYVVMPNHTHGILIIDKNDAEIRNDENNLADIPDSDDTVQTLQCNVSIVNKIGNEKNTQMKKISPKPGSISTIIRSYKSATTKFARKINIDFEWQTRFHDHIIKNDASFYNIHHYILNNPQKWEADKFFNK
jgi:putative transposase